MKMTLETWIFAMCISSMIWLTNYIIAFITEKKRTKNALAFRNILFFLTAVFMIEIMFCPLLV